MEHGHHMWTAHSYYRFIDGDGWRSDVDIIKWRYKDTEDNT